MASRRYIVQPGDCVYSIASREGLPWTKIWDHPENNSLRRKRSDPGILQPGDELFIPEKETKEVKCSTEARHRFQLRVPTCEYSIRFLRFGVPRANVPFCLDAGGNVIRGRTDQKGFVRGRVRPSVSSGLLILEENGQSETYRIDLGHLDPQSEWSGIQKRLYNLGFGCQVTGQDDDQTHTALAAYRSRYRLNCSDQETINDLKQQHGS